LLADSFFKSQTGLAWIFSITPLSYFIQATARTGGPELATDSFFKSRRVSGRENEKDYVLGGSKEQPDEATSVGEDMDIWILFETI
jgi:hypothetical protein